jgi:CheY-like chemotaxis protein
LAKKDQFTVLMADDDEDDCFLAENAFLEISTKVAFFCIEDGLELMNYLSEHSKSELLNGLPNLILLDLNMPRKDGRQALREIKAEPILGNIPIVILTNSKEEKDISFSMEAGAELFITKPANFDEWVKIMKSLTERWLR